MTITNAHGIQIDYATAVNLMDDTIREAIAANGIEDEQAFFDLYAIIHFLCFGEEWELAKENPIY